MKRYCQVENNQVIVCMESLPTSWKNITNFHLASDDFARENGWYPCEIINDGKEVVVSSSYEITEDKTVKEIIITRDKNEEEIQREKNKTQNEQWRIVRSKRNDLLTYSDKQVTSDKWESMSLNLKMAWKNYRTLLLDIPQSFSDPDSIVWPTFEEEYKKITDVNINNTI